MLKQYVTITTITLKPNTHVCERYGKRVCIDKTIKITCAIAYNESVSETITWWFVKTHVNNDLVNVQLSWNWTSITHACRTHHVLNTETVWVAHNCDNHECNDWTIEFICMLWMVERQNHPCNVLNGLQAIPWAFIRSGDGLFPWWWMQAACPEMQHPS